ncbi:hypothetical protein GCM10007170_13590 [Arthrobacter liuii]|uniref:Uncharacterized protein n=1 Tax=Arthrobacter liuii TaxID=1476996 RepID=A0ABQ2ANF8_9MICC|nr:hypothetical protein GCM10007170_13590 [Arthrobacter liuii]
MAEKAGTARWDYRPATEFGIDCLDGNRTSHQRTSDANHPAKIIQGSLFDVDPAIGVINPVDRDFVDPQPRAFSDDQQLSIEEPAVIFHMREQTLSDVGPYCLKSALRIGEPDLHRPAEQEVIGARNKFPLRTATDA